MKTLPILLTLLLSPVLGHAGELASGDFTLRMTVPDMAKKDIELPGTLKLVYKQFTFDTTDIGGDPITIQGVITKEGILMSLTKDEHDYLVTFHLTGVVDKNKDNTASGKVSIFKDHERVAHGEWTLKKKSEQDAPSNR